MLLEVIAQSVADARAAEEGGADRIELVRDLDRGGLTPPIALVEAVLASVRIPVRIMLREQEPFVVRSLTVAERMYQVARQMAGLPIGGLVLGFIDDGGAIDGDLLGRVLACSPGVPVTFHRALEDVVDLGQAGAVLRRHPQVDRVLISGGGGSAADRLRHLEAAAAAVAPVRVLAAVGQDRVLMRAVAAAPHLGEIHVGRAAREPESHDGVVVAAKVRELRAAAAGTIPESD